MIHGINNTTLSGVTITSGTTYSIDGGNYNYLTGDLVNQGTIQVGVSGNAARLYVVPSTVTLSGCGTINLNDPNSYLIGANGNETLQNQGNTIEGPGSILNLTVVNIPPNPPTATTEAATNITTTGATLNGSVNPNVGETTAWFIYGTDPTLTTGTSSTAAEATDCGCGSGGVPVAAAISGLQPGTTYYDEVVATSAGGTVDGSILNFTTAQAPAITSVNSTTFTVGTAGTFTVTATGYSGPDLQRDGVPAQRCDAQLDDRRAVAAPRRRAPAGPTRSPSPPPTASARRHPDLHAHRRPGADHHLGATTPPSRSARPAPSR